MKVKYTGKMHMGRPRIRWSISTTDFKMRGTGWHEIKKERLATLHLDIYKCKQRWKQRIIFLLTTILQSTGWTSNCDW
jgi:hypothetical protein